MDKDRSPRTNKGRDTKDNFRFPMQQKEKSATGSSANRHSVGYPKK
jgi:hypothetical protein